MTNGDKIRSMTDEELREKVWINEAVDMVMERLEKLKNEIGGLSVVPQWMSIFVV